MAPALCNGVADAYVAPMPIFPRPVSPKSALADLREMFSADRQHRWTFLGLSVAITGVLVWGLMLDSRTPPREREIIYVESWMADRRDSDIIQRQIIDLAKYEKALEGKQREFQKLADSVGIAWREDEIRNREQRRATIAAMNRMLKKKLADALALEKRDGRSNATAAAPLVELPKAR
jgi:hypothetical protein